METNTADYAIEAEGIGRSFAGTQALKDFTLRVPRGCIYGFLGRNGAGKTTAIKILAGLIKPDAGTVRVLGVNPFELSAEDRQRLGYLSEKQILPVNMKVGKLMAFCSRFYPKWDHELTRRLAESFRIDPKKKISALSQGGQRQVAFILALAQRPELLILDEPASTLDVVARREFLDEILDLLRQGGERQGGAGSGPTVFISSHILSDIERVADQIGILAEGTLKVSEPLDTLKETIKRVRFHSFARDPGPVSIPGAFRTVRSGSEILATLRLADGETPARLAQRLGAEYEIEDLNLEEIFVELSRS